MAEIKRDYISSIDILRIVSMFAVISIHTEARFCVVGQSFFSDLIHYIPRFAVPVFFLIAGYLWAKSLEKDSSLRHFWLYLKRLIILFISWTVIYRLAVYMSKLVLKHNFLSAIKDRPDSILDLPFVGYSHLWFLASLAIGLGIIYVLIKLKKEHYVISVSIMLYIIGLLGKDYSLTPFGLHNLPQYFNTRNGPFLSCLFLSIGWCLYRHRRTTTIYFSIVLAISGLVLSVIEIFFLRHTGTLFTTCPEFLIGTIPFGVGIFMIALAKPDSGVNQPLVKEVGKNILGVYVIHYLVMLVISRSSYMLSGPIWHIIFPCVVFFISLGIVYLLLYFRVTSWLVTGKFDKKGINESCI